MSLEPTQKRARGFAWRAISALGTEVRADESRVVTALTLYCFLLGAFQFASKTIRQSTFVDSLGFQSLPWVYLLVAVCAYPLLTAYSRYTIRVPFHRLLTISTWFVAASLVLFWWLFRFPSAWIRFVFYIWISIVTVMMVSQFWTFANQALDPRQARRLFSLILSGGLIGGVAGGQVARFASSIAGTRATLLANIVLLSGTLLTVPVVQRYIRGRSEVVPRKAVAGVERARGTLHLINSSPNLRSIAILMVLSILVAQIIDLQFNWVIQNATESLDQRTVLFGNLYSLMGLVAFLFQILVTSRVHRTMGIGTALRILPVSLTGALLALLLIAALFTGPVLVVAVAAMKIGENALRYSLDQGTRELLYVPVPAEIRARVKGYIDVLVQRFAKSLSAVVLLTVTFGWLTPMQMGWFGLAILVVWMLYTGIAHRHYVAAFRQGLLSRQIDPDDRLDLDDAGTLEALIRSLGSREGPEVVNAIEILASQGRSHLVPPLMLRHDDRDVRLLTLKVLESSERTDAVPWVQEALSDDDPELRAQALQTLTALSGSAELELMLPRLRDSDPRVRGTAVVCLMRQSEGEPREKASAVLEQMLVDADPLARIEAARALGVVEGEDSHYNLLQLLYDQDVRVIQQTIASVRLRSGSEGDLKVFAPVLISLLRERRLKHEAREALVAGGEGIIPLMKHFMNDPDEQPWVRLALPKTLARFPGTAAREALVDSLDTPEVALKRKIIEALGALRSVSTSALLQPELNQRHVLEEGRLHLEALADLRALSDSGDFDVHGARVHWRRETPASFLQHLVMDRMDEHLENAFGILALGPQWKETWTAFESIRSGDRRRRSHALEYLDNSLPAGVRTQVIVLIDDMPLDQRIAAAGRLYGVKRRSRVETLSRLVRPAADGDSAALWIAAAAIEMIGRESLEELFPIVEELAGAAEPAILVETANWALERSSNAA